MSYYFLLTSPCEWETISLAKKTIFITKFEFYVQIFVTDFFNSYLVRKNKTWLYEESTMNFTQLTFLYQNTKTLYSSFHANRTYLFLPS